MGTGWYWVVGLQEDRSLRVSTKHKANGVRFVDRGILRVACIRKWLHKCITVLLMFEDIVSKVHNNSLVESLDLAVCL